MEKDVKTRNTFPYKIWLFGALLGAVLAYSDNMSFNPGKDIITTTHPFIFYLFLLAIIGLLPIYIAYKKNIKNAIKAYWFAFAAMCAPAGIIWFIISLCIAIFGKRVENISKKRLVKG